MRDFVKIPLIFHFHIFQEETLTVPEITRDQFTLVKEQMTVDNLTVDGSSLNPSRR